ncbi:hypothetical protein ERO13_D02G015600v2 [Gossypium hirsutum]|nr:hypothetical protein ERO13_D02G015600v2 [Gossypium hirsutum]
MEESNNYGHQHPLLLILNQDQLIHNQSGVTHCSRCGEEVSVPCFCCVEHCGFYLHKACADAPLELNHPFHPHHPLVLLQEPPSSYTGCVCDFCDKTCQKFIYHCSCELDFHIKCALFTFNVAENNLKELDHVSLQHPLISTGNGDEELEDVSKCFGCREPLAKYTQFSPDCRFNLHEKCAKLPFKLNHNCHHKHPFTLQFNSERLSCKICQVTRRRGFVYGCSPCKFVVHIECVSESLDLVVEDKRHRHPLTLLLRGSSFICDACGTEGSYASYICCTCNIMVHKKCTSLPRIIKSKWHDHRLFHKYFLRIEDFRVLDCIICHDEVNTEHGSYYCSKCTVIFHVKCVMEDKDSYEIVENEDEESPDESVSSITKVLERNDAGEATVIEHFKHNHYLILSDRVGEYDDKCCGGCLLPIVASFYYCTLCDFFLHKVCVELPKVKHVWHHRCRPPLVLISNEVFECVQCLWLSNAFAYKCEECETLIQKAIFAMYVKKVEIQIFGFTIVQHVILLLISIVFLVNIHSSNLGVSLNYVRRFMSTLSLLLRRFITIRTAVSVVSPVSIWLLSVLRATSLSIKSALQPRIIRSKWHDHRLFLQYFLRIEDFRVLDCIICHDEVNTEHSSYYCSKCPVIFHMECVMKYKDSYAIVENEDEESPDESVSSITKVLERNDA